MQAGISRLALRVVLLFAIVLGMVLARGAGSVDAENLGPGGGTRIIVGDEVVGPYRLLVTSAPEPAQVGTVTFVVRVSDPQSGEKERNAQITVELIHSETGEKLTGVITHRDAGNPIDYALHLLIEQPGVYNGTLHISGPAGVSEVTFTQQVLARRQLVAVLEIGLPFAVVLGLLAYIALRRSGSQPQAPMLCDWRSSLALSGVRFRPGYVQVFGFCICAA
jgi:hypothetical protein